ncbi:MAG: FtsX-like permease family protein [Synechococcaceae cyanobacterium SM2_3_1]|nr:FtsX-like permease family protein [Synechococcaceae cyanobacterium SM2_3_1]
MATESLRTNRLRTGLTILGVVIGISSVIALNSIGQGVQQASEGLLQSLGTDVIVVLAGNPRVGVVGQIASSLTLEDAEAIDVQAPAVDGAAGFISGGVQMVYQDENTFTRASGTVPAFTHVRNWDLSEGRFFTQEEVDELQQVVVLGDTIRDRIFGAAPAIGERVRINGERFTVIGVLEPKGGLGGADPDDQIYLPITTMATRLVGNNSLSGIALTGIFIRARSQEEVDAAQFQITNLLRLRNNILPGDEDDFAITSQFDLQNTLNLFVGLFTTFVVSIGGVSLVVGGIGIANIMLVAVVERTREIGVRKALGATEAAILYQFLSEAVLVSLGGGVIGIGLGISIAWMAALAIDIPLIVAPEAIMISFSLAFAVGLLAGVAPARSAAKLDPITALRTD